MQNLVRGLHHQTYKAQHSHLVAVLCSYDLKESWFAALESCSGATELALTSAKGIFPSCERQRPITASLIQESSQKYQTEKWNPLQILTPPDSPTMSKTAAATLDYTGEVYDASVAPEKEFLKTQHGPGMDKYRPTTETLVPGKINGAFDDEFVDSPLWSSTLTEKYALLQPESEYTDLFPLEQGFPLEMCEAMDQPSLDKDFFEQFLDLNGDDVADFDFSQFIPTDVCQPDMVATMSTIQKDASTALCVNELASPTCDSRDEITVIQTSDTVPSVPPSPPDALSCGFFDEAVDFPELFKALENPALSTCEIADIALPSVQEPAAVQPPDLTVSGKRTLCELTSPSQTRKVKKARSLVSDSDSSKSVPSPTVLSHKSERRRKNNVASKHARAARKERENNLFLQEEELEQSNAELKVQLEKLTKEAELLRKVVIEKLSRSNVA